MKNNRWSTAPLLLPAVAALLFSGCASSTKPPGQGVPPPCQAAVPDADAELADARKRIHSLQQEKARLEANLKKSRKRNRELQMELLDRTAQVHQLEAQKEQAIGEVVQTKARLRSRQSKAETVANLAEVRLALQQVLEKGAGAEAMLDLEQARELIDMAEQALNEENLEGASYLMAQARELITGSRGQGAATKGRRLGEVLFQVPFDMEVRRKGNVRLEPGMQSEVLFQLDTGDKVFVLGRRGNWLHIRTADNRTGWMHFDLLESPG